MRRAIAFVLAAAAGVGAEPPPDLAGLWAAKRIFGPDARGTLTIDERWMAEIAGHTAPVRRAGDEVSFELLDGEGGFRGTVKNGRIVGHWIQPRMVSAGYRHASPVTLTKERGRWRGTVAPADDEMTFYLRVTAAPGQGFAAFLRNPDRNLGRLLGVERVVVDGRTATLLGRSSKDAPLSAVAGGLFDGEALSISLRGGTYDFVRDFPADHSGFDPRGKRPEAYVYRPPLAEDDGWPVATLDEAGISREAISKFVQRLIDTPMDSVHAPEIHGVLLARRGKLVLEEYFHGFHREALHDTRSAAKSLTSVLAGAAALRGQVRPSTPVFQTMGASAADPRKAAMTLENLMTMSSGLDCDDADANSPGNENTMQSQSKQPDWYRFTLDLGMVRQPGEKAVYCSVNANLAGGVLARATGRWLPDLFRELLAEPLQIRRYAMNLTPAAEGYMGGGVRFLPRDFMKLGQVMLDGGKWRGRQIVSADWVKRSVSPLYELQGVRYGYHWWVTDYPYKDRKVRAFYAAGNGGQIVMGVPELELLIAFWGGNYSDAALFIPQRVYVPQFILTAVDP